MTTDTRKKEENTTQKTKEIDILARTLFGEARGESDAGLVAVAWVVLNRVRFAQQKPYGYWWGNDVVAVCLRPWQFSCWNQNDPNVSVIQNVTRDNPRFQDCVQIAKKVMAGQILDPTEGATHYHHVDLTPHWTQNATKTVQIGAHLFYKDIA